MEWEPAVCLTLSCTAESHQPTLLLVPLLLRLPQSAAKPPLPSLAELMETPLIIQGIDSLLGGLDSAGKSTEIQVVLGWAAWGLPVLTDSLWPFLSPDSDVHRPGLQGHPEVASAPVTTCREAGDEDECRVWDAIHPRHGSYSHLLLLLHCNHEPVQGRGTKRKQKEKNKIH